jgi:glutathione peroxidase
MKTFILSLILFTASSSFYDFKMPAIDGKTIDFSQYKGKPVLIVNTASKCGNTPQYADLQKLHEQYGDKVIILGFPANNFGGQEPGSNIQIAEFCQQNYGVSFQMFEKISVKGDDQHELYKWLKEKTGQEPTWNFCKYLVKPDGTVKFFSSKVKPLDIVSEL